MNKDNFTFYKNLSVQKLNELSQIGGFESCEDLRRVYPKIKETSSLLELGAGIGRCVRYLLEENYMGKITAIEQSEDYLEFLSKNYSDKVEVIDGDFLDYRFDNRFDVVLWMWSGILDFTPEEQIIAVKKIGELINDGGTLVIDTPRIGFRTFATHESEQHISLDSEYGHLDCYIPSEEEVNSYAKESGFVNVERDDYLTTSKKERTLYILTKGN